jgi:hypothetical protein
MTKGEAAAVCEVLKMTEGIPLPAKSEAQRRLLNAKFGHAWVKAHHFDNKGNLPAKVGKKKAAPKVKHKGKKKRSKK